MIISEENRKDISNILNKYGDQKQKEKIIEELDELKEQIEFDIKGSPDKEHIIEEAADVYIMLEHLKLIYKIPEDKIKDVVKYKLERQNNRMKMS